MKKPKIIDDFTEEDKVKPTIKKNKWISKSGSRCQYRIASKPHECDNCWDLINTGERYLEITYYHEYMDTHLTKRICLDCTY